MTRSETTPAASGQLLEMRGIWKSFGGVPVLKDVNLEVRAGEVHALCGENGAGKSTLMNILAGTQRLDAGEIVFDGIRHTGFEHAHAAQNAGVAMVFQERSLFAPLTVAENIFAGRQPVRYWGMIDGRRMHSQASRLLSDVAPDVDAGDRISDLTPAQQQMVEVAKALSLRARLIIFDEPTAALSAAETHRLFSVLRSLRERGVGIVYISHRLEEIFAVADRVTVLKDGAWLGTLPVKDTNPDDLIRRMVGRDVECLAGGTAASENPKLLEVANLCDPVTLTPSPIRLNGVSFHVRAGEIVGLAGLAGAGRTETALSLFGARRRGLGDVLINGRPVNFRTPQEAIAAGLGYLSEDRKESGLFLNLSVRRNISAAQLRHFGTWKLRDDQEFDVARDFQQRLRIVCRNLDQDIAHLSGGNQQKVLLARWLLVSPRVLIADEPTRGIDVGAKAQVHQWLRDFARQGHGVLMISSELPEVLSLSDRIYVMRAGRVAGELSQADATEESVMQLAAGADERTLQHERKSQSE